MPLVAPWNRKKRADRRAQRENRARGSRHVARTAHRRHLRVRREARSQLREDWTCEKCGRRWDTNQIQADQYDGDPAHPAALPRPARRLRARCARASDVLHAHRQHLLGVHPAASVADAVVLPWPAHRRRYRKAIAELPRWELRRSERLPAHDRQRRRRAPRSSRRARTRAASRRRPTRWGRAAACRCTFTTSRRSRSRSSAARWAGSGRAGRSRSPTPARRSPPPGDTHRFWNAGDDELVAAATCGRPTTRVLPHPDVRLDARTTAAPARCGRSTPPTS